jgi:hypothetical protein
MTRTPEETARLNELLPPLDEKHNPEAYMLCFGLERSDAEEFCRMITHEIDNEIMEAIYTEGIADGQRHEEWTQKRDEWRKNFAEYITLINKHP